MEHAEFSDLTKTTIRGMYDRIPTKYHEAFEATFEVGELLAYLNEPEPAGEHPGDDRYEALRSLRARRDETFSGNLIEPPPMRARCQGGGGHGGRPSGR
ncbi:MAG: hypothetical protein ACRDTM_11065 [Micromonosporaceae bacterium]